MNFYYTRLCIFIIFKTLRKTGVEVYDFRELLDFKKGQFLFMFFEHGRRIIRIQLQCDYKDT